MNAKSQQKKDPVSNNVVRLMQPTPLSELVIETAQRDIGEVLDICLNESQINHAQACLNLQTYHTFAVGSAGGGRTFMSVLAALFLKTKGVVDDIIVTRPAVTADESLGFLPGGIDEKLGPFAEPIYDATKLFGVSPEIVQVVPIAFMRGRTFRNSAIIADEIQNTTPKQMHMLLTRLGRDSYMFLNGDLQQCDLPKQRQPNGVWLQPQSGLHHYLRLVERRYNANLTKPGLLQQGRQNIVTYDQRHIVRHEAVADMVELYDWGQKNPE